jgi:hypothetical protein
MQIVILPALAGGDIFILDFFGASSLDPDVSSYIYIGKLLLLLMNLEPVPKWEKFDPNFSLFEWC